MVKIIAFDLDGTLYDKHKHIDEDTVHKIIELEQKGIVVGIVTERFYEELGEVIEKIKLREYNGFVASSNGLEIHDFLDGEKKCFTRLSKDEVKELFSSFNGDISAGLINVTMNSAPTFLAYADVKNGNALEALYKNKQALGLKKGEDIMELGKDEYVYKTRGMNIFFGIKDKQMYATNDELLYKSIGKAVDKSIKDAPYAAEMKGKTVFMAINAEAILDLPVVKMLVGFGGKEFKTYSDLASKVSYLSVSSEGETSETDLCLKDKDVNALKQIVDFAKQFAGM